MNLNFAPALWKFIIENHVQNRKKVTMKIVDGSQFFSDTIFNLCEPYLVILYVSWYMRAVQEKPSRKYLCYSYY